MSFLRQCSFSDVFNTEMLGAKCIFGSPNLLCSQIDTRLKETQVVWVFFLFPVGRERQPSVVRKVSSLC